MNTTNTENLGEMFAAICKSIDEHAYRATREELVAKRDASRAAFEKASAEIEAFDKAARAAASVEKAERFCLEVIKLSLQSGVDFEGQVRSVPEHKRGQHLLNLLDDVCAVKSWSPAHTAVVMDILMELTLKHKYVPFSGIEPGSLQTIAERIAPPLDAPHLLAVRTFLSRAGMRWLTESQRAKWNLRC